MRISLQVGALRGTRLNKQSLLLLGITAQLVLVVCGAAQIRFGNDPVGKFLKFYGALTGADSGYGFFAPGVGSQVRVSVDLQTGPEKVVPAALPSPSNREANLRVGNVMGWFLSEGTDLKMRRSLAASWAGKALGSMPEATAAVVKIEQYRLVSARAFVEGQRPQWTAFYQATFKRRDPKGNGLP